MVRTSINGRRIAALLGAIVLATMAAAVSAGAATTPIPRPERWSQKKSADQPDAANALVSVACPTAARCVAVGSWDHVTPHHPSGIGGTLVETLASYQWSLTPSPGQTPDGYIKDVSCPTESRCYAVGSLADGPVILTSTGDVWSTMTTPPLTRVGLDAISCATATRCIAVGTIAPHTNSEPYAISLSGGTWTPMTVPSGGGDGNFLSDLSCTSATECVAVGWRNENDPSLPVALRLSGGTWTRLAPPSRNASTVFQGVSCTSATRCVMVGASDTKLTQRNTLVERWSDGAWTIMESPNVAGLLNSLTSVDCTDLSHCIAVGQGGDTRPLIQKLAGGVWSTMTAPPAGTDGILLGVDCPTSSACVAVGQINGNGGNHAHSYIVRSQ